MSLSALFNMLGPETCKQMIRDQDAESWDEVWIRDADRAEWENEAANGMCCGCGETLDGQRVCCQPDADALHQLGDDAE